MPEAVVDSSALAAVLFQEAESALVLSRMAGLDLIAPQLLAYEIGNVATMKVRRDPSAAAWAEAGIRKFEELEIEFVAVRTRIMFDVAASHRLTAYDAAYLVLAAARGVTLITLDRQLASAAARVLTPRV
jgi:predicted nucleic acid-binding protein